MRLLAQADLNSIIGEITPVGPMTTGTGSEMLGKIIVWGVGVVVFIASLALFGYLLWGALDWSLAGGDSAKIESAKAKMTHAVLGIIMVVVSVTIFIVVAYNILGIVKMDTDGGIIFNLPQLGK